MLRIKLRRPYKGNKRGDVIEVTNNEAFGLVNLGSAEVTDSKTYTSTEVATYSDKVLVSDEGKKYSTKGKIDD